MKKIILLIFLVLGLQSCTVSTSSSLQEIPIIGRFIPVSSEPINEEIKLVDIEVTHDNISFGYDNLNTEYFRSIRLYDEDLQLLSSIDSPAIRSFRNLLSDKKYIIIMEYTGRDGEGNEIIYEVYYGVDEEIRTLSFQAPTIDLSAINKTHSTANFSANFIDKDETIMYYQVRVFDNLENGTLIYENDEFGNIELNHLKPNTEYLIQALITYDLNNGEGKKTLETSKSFVTNSIQEPSLTLEVSDIDLTKVVFNVIVEDTDNLGKIVSIKVYDIQNNFDVFVDLNDFDGNEKEFIIENLLSNKKYLIDVVFEYDMLDEIGRRILTQYYEFSTLKATTPIAQIYSIDESFNKATIDFEIISPDVDINIINFKVSKTLSFGRREEVYSLIQLNDNTLPNLSSNTEYEIEITYEYDLLDGNGIQTKTIKSIFKTLELTIPSVTIEVTERTYSSISFDLNINDPLELSNIKEIQLIETTLILIEKVVQTLSPNEEYIFNNLNSDSAFKIKVIFEYNLQDGKGIKEESTSTNSSTLKYNVPQLSIINVSENNKVVNFDITTNDPFDFIKIKEIKLIEDKFLFDTLIETIFEDDLYEFRNLKTSTDYIIEVVYEYDLLDGDGVQSKTVKITFKSG